MRFRLNFWHLTTIVERNSRPNLNSRDTLDALFVGEVRYIWLQLRVSLFDGI